MAGFKLDFNDKFENGVADGIYEVVVFKANEDATKNGAEFVNIDLIIRNDIDQKFKNAHIFHRIWKSKETGNYNARSFNTIGWALNLDENKEYPTIDDLLEDFFMRTARVRVKNEESEYNGNTYNNLNVKSWDRSKFPEVNHQFRNKENNAPTPIDISDDDLPF